MEGSLQGLLGIKGASVKEVDVLVKKRPENGYKSLEEMLELTRFSIKNKKDENGKNIVMPKLGKGTFVALAKVGVFDEFGYSRKVLIDYATEILSPTKKKRLEAFEAIKNISDTLNSAERVKFEIDLLGFAITDIKIKDSNFDNIKNSDNCDIKASCIEIKKKVSKKGKEYGILRLYANFNTIEALCFNQDLLTNIEDILLKSNDNVIKLNVSHKNGTIFVNSI